MIERDLKIRPPEVSRESVRDRTATVLDEAATYFLVGAAYFLLIAALDAAISLLADLTGDGLAAYPANAYVLDSLSYPDFGLSFGFILPLVMVLNGRDRDRKGYALLVVSSTTAATLLTALMETADTLSFAWYGYGQRDPRTMEMVDNTLADAGGVLPYLGDEVLYTVKEAVVVCAFLGLFALLFAAVNRSVTRRVEG